MDNLFTKAEVEAKLAHKSDAITRRIQAMGDEVESTTEDLKEKLLNHPLIGIGAMLAAGLLVGWLASGRKKTEGAEALMDAYADVVVQEARRRVQKGMVPEEALAESLKCHSPRILVPPTPLPQKKGGLFRIAGRIMGGMLINTAIAAGTKRLAEYLPDNISSQEVS